MHGPDFCYYCCVHCVIQHNMLKLITCLSKSAAKYAVMYTFKWQNISQEVGQWRSLLVQEALKLLDTDSDGVHYVYVCHKH